MPNCRELVFQKIVSMLAQTDAVTKYVGAGSSARIYTSHLSTIKDYELPCVSIHVLPSPGRDSKGAFADFLELQIEPWMYAVGQASNVWDNIIECANGITNALHRCGGWDESIGIRIIEMTNIGRGPQIEDDDGVMHYPTRWRIQATL